MKSGDREEGIIAENSIEDHHEIDGSRRGHWVRRHVADITDAGPSQLPRKIMLLAALGLAFLPVIAIRLLRPLVVFRFGELMSYRIGHYAGNTDVFISERQLGIHGHRTIDIFHQSPIIANRQLSKMWKRTLRITPLASYLDRVNRLIPGGARHSVQWRTYHYRDIYGTLEKTQPHLSFIPDEVSKGKEALRGLGLQASDSYICFLARDSAYLDDLQPGKSWNYHDYRNSSISSYLPAVDELTRRGYFALRMGAVVQEPVESDNPMIIDYASKHRTDFLDIYLSANCRFFLSSGSGIDQVATIFRRPIMYVNYAPLDWAHFWAPDHLFIPKKVWLRADSRFMTFREILESGVGNFGKSEQYEEFGIDLLENTPEEISAVTLEMDDRLQGVWQTTEEDDDLQQRFRSLFKQGELHGVMNSRIGAEFLRQNRELLG